MKINVPTDLLRDALGKLLSVVDRKSSRPILSFALFTAKDNLLEISATDLEVSAKITIEANVERLGEFCVNAKNIFDIVRELPTGQLSLEALVEENLIKMNCENIQYSLLVNSPDEFPKLTFGNDDVSFVLNSEQITEIINKTSFAISSDETRPFLNGIFFQEVDSKLRAVATDGHRLSLIETEINNSDLDYLINGIILPRKGVFELKKIADSFPDKDLFISVDDSFLYVNAENSYSLSIRLISREYPKYQAVIPNKTTYNLIVDRAVFLNAVKRVKIMSFEKSNGIKLNIYNNEMVISANHPSFGDALETIPIEYDGKEMLIGFNAKYLLDTLPAFNEGDISFEFNNEFSPVIIKSSSLPHYLSIVMPLNIQ